MDHRVAVVNTHVGLDHTVAERFEHRARFFGPQMVPPAGRVLSALILAAANRQFARVKPIGHPGHHYRGYVDAQPSG